MRISQQTLVLVADGQNATFFKNTASGETISLETVHSMGLVNEADRDISADRPGIPKLACPSAVLPMSMTTNIKPMRPSSLRAWLPWLTSCLQTLKPWC